MKFFDFGSLGFYRFFDFQKYFNFSIFRYSLINYYSYKEQSTLINDASVFKIKTLYLDQLYNKLIMNHGEEEFKSINESFETTLELIINIIRKYHENHDILTITRKDLFSSQANFDLFRDKLKYLNFKINLKHKIEQFEKNYKDSYSCIRIATYFIKEEFFNRLDQTIDFFYNESNNNNLDVINKELADYKNKVEQIKHSLKIKETHKKFIIEHVKDKINKTLYDHSLDISKLLVKVSLIEITIQNFEVYYLNLVEILEVLLSIKSIFDIGFNELPDKILGEWNEMIYTKRKEFQKMVLISDYVFQKKIVSTINTGGWKFTFFTLSPRQGDIFQLSIEYKKNFSNIEDAIKAYGLKIDQFNVLKSNWQDNLKQYNCLFNNVN